jgi:hypothetical protein
MSITLTSPDQRSRMLHENNFCDKMVTSAQSDPALSTPP